MPTKKRNKGKLRKAKVASRTPTNVDGKVKTSAACNTTNDGGLQRHESNSQSQNNAGQLTDQMKYLSLENDTKCNHGVPKLPRSRKGKNVGRIVAAYKAALEEAAAANSLRIDLDINAPCFLPTLR